MIKIAALHAFIQSLNVVSADQIDSYIDKIDTVPAGRLAGSTTTDIVLSTCKYTAMFYIAGYPHQETPVELLVAQLSAWLLEQDDERTEPNDFSINVDVLDENGNVMTVANLELEITLNEHVIITRNDGGTIEFNGNRYSLV